MILNPTADRTHYHLIYGTRSDEGLVAFREVERRGIEFQRAKRADAQQRGRVQRSKQGELFGGREMFTRAYEDELRARYLLRAEQRLDAMLKKRGNVVWDELVVDALQVPMIAESDVKAWLKDRQASGAVTITGLAPRARVPQGGSGHRVWSVM